MTQNCIAIRTCVPSLAQMVTGSNRAKVGQPSCASSGEDKMVAALLRGNEGKERKEMRTVFAVSLLTEKWQLKTCPFL